MQSRTIHANTTFRSGMTVIEILIAAALALILIVAMVQIFAVVGNAVTMARATLEMSGELRMAAHRLNQDLEGVTVPVRPWTSPTDGQGYFEYIEGPSSDRDADADGTDDVGQVNTSGQFSATDTFGLSAGDIDDVLMFTARSSGEPFVGRIDSSIIGGTAGTFTTVESNVAEIIWWTVFNDQNANGNWDPGEPLTLRRRVLLVLPGLNNPAGIVSTGTTPRQMRLFYNQNDVSVRPHRDASGAVVGLAANSLADLTKRENRFAHYSVDLTAAAPEYAFNAGGVGFPFPANVNPTSASPTSLYNLVKWDVEPGPNGVWGNVGDDDGINGVDDIGEAGLGDDVTQNRRGEDVILSNVVAFDVRLYDPAAPIRVVQGPDGAWGIATVDDDNLNGPDDIGEAGAAGSDDVTLSPGDPGFASATTPIGNGAFVDLNHGASPGDFFDLPNAKSQLTLPTYCTWSFHYENDGIDQDDGGSGAIDEGTNGLDDDSANGVDDPGERETSPPYPFPVRGMKITLRVIELDTKQVRQTSVVTDFRPE